MEDDELLQRPYHERNQVADVLGREWWEAIEAYFDASSRLAAAILRGLVVSLGGEPGTVDEAFARPACLSTLRFNFYPVRESPVAVSKEDDRGGLQVQGTDQRWYSTLPDADAFVVNTGLALRFWYQPLRQLPKEATAARLQLAHARGVKLQIQSDTLP